MLLSTKLQNYENPIKSQVKTIDELSSRYTESEPGEVSALFLSP